jgi:hypothetical protein
MKKPYSKTADKIHSHIHSLRQLAANAEDLGDKHRANAIRRVTEEGLKRFNAAQAHYLHQRRGR